MLKIQQRDPGPKDLMLSEELIAVFLFLVSVIHEKENVVAM